MFLNYFCADSLKYDITLTLPKLALLKSHVISASVIAGFPLPLADSILYFFNLMSYN